MNKTTTKQPEQPQRCVKCGHSDGVERTLRRCKARIDGGEALCQCHCEFAPAETQEQLTPAGACEHGVADDFCEDCYRQEHDHVMPDLLDDEEAALVIGAIPLQALPPETQEQPPERERAWIEWRTQHAFTVKPDPHIETVEYARVRRQEMTPERWEELQAALDSPSGPTEAEAEEVLQHYGTSGREVTNQFIERLLRENLELKRTVAARSAPVTAETARCPFCDSGLTLTEKEVAAVADLSQRLDLRPARVWVQALRVYQLHVLGEPDLSKVAASPAPDIRGAAEEINRYYNGLVGFNIRVKGPEEVAAIITKYLQAGPAGENDSKSNYDRCAYVYDSGRPCGMSRIYHDRAHPFTEKAVSSESNQEGV